MKISELKPGDAFEVNIVGTNGLFIKLDTKYGHTFGDCTVWKDDRSLGLRHRGKSW